MNEPPRPDEKFMNTNNDEVLTFIGHTNEGEYSFSRPSGGTLDIPTELWHDDDVDWFESMGMRV